MGLRVLGGLTCCLLFEGFGFFRLVVIAGFVWVCMVQFLRGLRAAGFGHWCGWGAVLRGWLGFGV